MKQQLQTCENCGSSWFIESSVPGDRAGAMCPICHFTPEGDAAPLAHIESIADLEGRLDALVRSALASGLAHPQVLHALRDELAFTAELGNVGRRFLVQLIDLGPQEEALLRRPIRDRRDIAADRSRS